MKTFLQQIIFVVTVFTFFYLTFKGIINPNPIQDGLFRGCLRVGGGKKPPSSLKTVTHILQWWKLAQLYLT